MTQTPSNEGRESELVTEFVLGGELTIDSAADWRQRLLDALAEGATLRLDLSALEQIDEVGMQLLCSLAVSLRARDQDLLLYHCNESFMTTIERMGLEIDELGVVAQRR